MSEDQTSQTEQDDSINVLDPHGELVSIPKTQLKDAQFNGFKIAGPEDEANYLKNQEFGTTGQQVLTGLEGAARTATFGLSDIPENVLSKMGVSELSPERRTAREEVNPGSKFIGSTAGLLIPGASSVLKAAGEGLTRVLGIGAGSVLSRIGSSMVKGAVETALIQSGDEVSKMLSNQTDPSKFVETAIPSIALSGLLGAVTGGVLGGAWEGGAKVFGKTIGKILQKAPVNEQIDKDIDTTLSAVRSTVHESSDKAAQEAATTTTTGTTTGTISPAITPESLEAGGNETRAELLKYGAPEAGVTNAMNESGMKDVPAELQSSMGQNPDQRFRAQVLRESPSQAGIYYRDSLSKFYDKAGDNIIEALGKTPQEAMDLSEMSENQVGKSMMNQLKDSLREKFQPLSDRYDEWFNKAAKVDITSSIRTQLEDNVGLAALSSGAAKLPGSERAKLVEFVQSALPLQKTLEDLSQLRSEIRGRIIAKPGELKFTGGLLLTAVKQAEEDLISHGYSSGLVKGSLAEFRKIQADYGSTRELLNDLNDRLGLKKWSGVNTFIDSMRDITPEKFLGKITSNNDANFINEILPHFPELQQSIKDYHLNDLIKDTVVKAKKTEDFNLTNLFKNLGAMSPEMKQFVLPENALNKINATRYLMNSIPERIGPSGTPLTLMALMKNHGASGVVALTSLLTGGTVAGAAIAGAIADRVNKEAPDAVKLGLLKYLGSSGEISAPGFRNMVDAIKNTINGENLIGSAVKGVFDASKAILPTTLIPTKEKREKLDETLQHYQVQPQSLMKIADSGSPYLEQQNVAKGQLAMNAVNILNSLRPGTDKTSPLDKDVKPNPMQKASFDRVLDFAEQPLLVLQHLKNGTLTTNDVNLHKAIYPSLYSSITDKLTHEMIDHTSKGNPIPYQTQLGLSKFLGQPIVSSALPQSMMQIQQAFMTKPQSQQSQQPPQKKSRSGSLKNIGDVVKLEGNDTQRRSISRWD